MEVRYHVPHNLRATYVPKDVLCDPSSRAPLPYDHSHGVCRGKMKRHVERSLSRLSALSLALFLLLCPPGFA